MLADFARKSWLLLLTAVVFGLMLSGLYSQWKPKIDANKENRIRRAARAVLPGASTLQKKIIGENVFYEGLDENGTLVGYALLASGTGFQGKIECVVGVDGPVKRILGMEVIDNVETPGLGNRIAEKEFESRFAGLNCTGEISYVRNRPPRNDREIQAITGATISSRSVVRIVNDKIRQMRPLLSKERDNDGG